MSAPAFTVSPHRFGDEVMLEMLDRDIRHVPVVWPHGEVLGVLSDRDLLVAETRTPFSLRRAIDDASDIDQLRRASARLRPAVISLHEAQGDALADSRDHRGRRRCPHPPARRAHGRRARRAAQPAGLAGARQPRQA